MLDIARLLATGRHQAKIATELSLTLSAVSRTVRDLRLAVALTRGDAAWHDATEYSAVEVARAWLADQEPGPQAS